MYLLDEDFTAASSILDVGGWFRPEPRATHVIDLMPWATRNARLCLQRLPGERFSPETWFQADFLHPDFRMPFADKSFDLVICGHTVEDLVEPGPLLREMSRVGQRGVIECPSRLSEQTMGVRDRECSAPGHPHHWWIVESEVDYLRLYSKRDSELNCKMRLLPLSHFESAQANFPGIGVVQHRWSVELKFETVLGVPCRERAEQFVRDCTVSRFGRYLDTLKRFARRCRSRLRGRPALDLHWWTRIVEQSSPYSKIELR